MKTNKITKAIAIMITTLLLILPFTSVSAFDSLQETDNNAEFEPGAVIVSLKSNSPSVTSLLNGFSIEEERLITPGSTTQNVYLVRFAEKTKEIVWRAIDVLKNSPYVITAEPDYYQYVDDEIEDIITDNPSSNPTTSTQPTTSAADTTQATNNNAEFEPGAVIVSLKSNSPSVTSLLNGFEIEEERLITPGSDTQNVYLVRFTEKTIEIVWRAIDVLKKSQYVVAAEPDFYQYVDDEVEETVSDSDSTEPVTTEPTESITDKPTEPVTTEPTESSSETLPKPSDPVPTETEPNPTEPSETATELISVNPMPPFEAVGKVGEYIFGYYDAECYELNQTCEIGAYTFFVDGSFYQYCGITDGKRFTPLVIAYEKGLINDEQLDKTVELMNLRIKEKGYFNTAGWTVMPTEPVTTEPTETITDKPTEPATTEPVVINPQPTENKPSTPTVVKPTVKKKANPVKVTAKTKSVKLKNVKVKAQKIKPLTIKNAQGKVSIKITSAKKAIKKYLKFNSKGTLTIKKWKKAKVGTYKIKVRITAKGNSKYKPRTLIKTAKITIT